MADSRDRRSGQPSGRTRAFDPSMKVRDAELFDDAEPEIPWSALEERKPFRQHLLDTPAAPIPRGLQVLLWSAAAVVAILFCLAAYRISQPRSESRARAARALLAPPSVPFPHARHA